MSTRWAYRDANGVNLGSSSWTVVTPVTRCAVAGDRVYEAGCASIRRIR